MNRIEQHLTEIKEHNQKALILYISAGDPDLDTTLSIMQALADNGTDCIELGMPFSDPVADGPVIQRSSARALKNNIQLTDIMKTITLFRQQYQTPVVMMGYLNPILRYGAEKFVKDFAQCGGDGLIFADLPWEEGEEIESICRDNGVSCIYLLAPEPGTERTRNILKSTSGFVYVVSHYGTTGVDKGPDGQVDSVLDSLRPMTDLPLAVGFGISSVEKAVQMSQKADGIIIGSWLVKELEAAKDKVQVAGEFARTVKAGIGG